MDEDTDVNDTELDKLVETLLIEYVYPSTKKMPHFLSIEKDVLLCDITTALVQAYEIGYKAAQEEK